MTGVSLFTRIDEQDRSLFLRLVIAEEASSRKRGVYRTLTHLGGAWVTIAACTVPLLLPDTHPMYQAALLGLCVLVISHGIVRIMKRTVGRPRPSWCGCARTFINEPTCFSFPSGHAAAAMSVAFAYGVVFPVLAVPLLVIALFVGGSRVCLGVHYPGDVVIGQMIALLTGACVLSL